ncbi:MAG: hypothetical protein PHV68_00235 [Candidatus Gastranaerophilales bacterium]|nr:hypothetical protein [Candidatus Gastranaerophilales bacterium]
MLIKNSTPQVYSSNFISFRGNKQIPDILGSLPQDIFINTSKVNQYKIDKTIKELTPIINNQIVENLFVIDKNGEIIPNLIKKGDFDFVGLSKKETKFIEKKGDCTMLHNHPEEITLSVTDIKNLFDYNLHQITAITPGGGCYTLKRNSLNENISSDKNIYNYLSQMRDDESMETSKLREMEYSSRAQKLKILNNWRKDKIEKFALDNNLTYEHKEGKYISVAKTLPFTISDMYAIYDPYD